MKLRLVVVAAAVSLSGCANLQQLGEEREASWCQTASAGYIGCDAADIEIDEMKDGQGGADSINMSWRATCRGNVMWCSATRSVAHCAPQTP
jgi:hypothetical protein